MSRRSNTRAAQGSGSIRQRPDGTWEARYIVGRDLGTGKQIRKSVYAKTQKEVRQRLAQAVAAIDNGDYFEPSKMTLGQCSATRFLRNGDRIFEKNSPRSKKQIRGSLACVDRPQTRGAAHARGRAF